MNEPDFTDHSQHIKPLLIVYLLRVIWRLNARRALQSHSPSTPSSSSSSSASFLSAFSRSAFSAGGGVNRIPSRRCRMASTSVATPWRRSAPSGRPPTAPTWSAASAFKGLMHAQGHGKGLRHEGYIIEHKIILLKWNNNFLKLIIIKSRQAIIIIK